MDLAESFQSEGSMQNWSMYFLRAQFKETSGPCGLAVVGVQLTLALETLFPSEAGSPLPPRSNTRTRSGSQGCRAAHLQSNPEACSAPALLRLQFLFALWLHEFSAAHPALGVSGGWFPSQGRVLPATRLCCLWGIPA